MVYGVSLGPGDPELLTIKALRVLQESDVIFYPGSSYQGTKKSYSFPLLMHHNLENKDLRGFYLDMSDDRAHAKKVYEIIALEIKELVTKGKKVSIVCEGDLSLYASFSYVLDHMKTLKISVELIPGINSFSLGAAEHKIPLGLLKDKIIIVPRIESIEEISKYLKKFDTLILMKIKTGWMDFCKELIKKNWQFFYGERLGTDQEYITTDLHEILSRKIPYFSLLIIKKSDR